MTSTASKGSGWSLAREKILQGFRRRLNASRCKQNSFGAVCSISEQLMARLRSVSIKQ